MWRPTIISSPILSVILYHNKELFGQELKKNEAQFIWEIHFSHKLYSFGKKQNCINHIFMLWAHIQQPSVVRYIKITDMSFTQ